MVKKKISVDHIRIGMYISSVDVGWLHNPLLSKKISKSNQIESLISHGHKNSRN